MKFYFTSHNQLCPKSQPCTHCQTPVTGFTDLLPPTSAGLKGAFSAICGHCGLMNYAIFGPGEKVREAYRQLALDKLKRYKASSEPFDCEYCGDRIFDSKEIPTEGIRGILSARAAQCDKCDKTSYLIKDDAESVQAVRTRLKEAGLIGSGLQMGKPAKRAFYRDRVKKIFIPFWGWQPHNQ